MKHASLLKLGSLLLLTWISWCLLPVRGTDAILPLVAFALNFSVSGWAVLLSKVIRIPSVRRYYRTFRWEAKLYETLGVRGFKKLVNSGWYRAVWGPSMNRSGKGGSLEGLVAEMRAAETAHLLAFVVVTGLTIDPFLRGVWAAVVWLTAGNVVINGYSVILQRYNRSRIDRIVAKAKARGFSAQGGPACDFTGESI
jgi:hypothetical protein